jgi:serine/threonine protein kinase
MDAPGKVPDSINCHACGAILDLTGQTGFTHVECKHCGALSVVPLQFGDFLLLNAIGIGGMGTVYKAIDLPLNRYLALKILRKKLSTNPSFIGSFSEEARAAASVNHPNVAQVYAFGEFDNQYYLSMELCGRGSLDDRITKLGRLPEAEVLSIGRQIASALLCAWQRGLLHRDVKPGNILFNEDGIPKIVDFGLARGHGHDAEDDKGRAPDQIWGTPYYIAPEKLRGRSEDLRSDIYSLGATLFHALAGRPPFEADTAGEVVSKHTAQPALSLKTYAPDLNERTIQVVARMLARDPTERYGTYEELIQDLIEAEDELKASPRVVVAPKEKRLSIVPLTGILVVLVVGVATIWLVWEKRMSHAQRHKSSVPSTAHMPLTGTPPQEISGAVTNTGLSVPKPLLLPTQSDPGHTASPERERKQ